MNAELHITLETMLAELEASALVVVVAPAPDSRHEGHGVRVVESKNAPWYRAFCARFPSSRRDQNRKGRTAIRRRETQNALRALLAGRPAGPAYAPRLLDAARAYWKRHAAELRERLEYETAA